MSAIKYKLGLLFSLLLLLWSCETVIELELPEYEPKLVLNSVINPDSLFTVDVSASQSALADGEYQQLTDATVQVYQAGQLLFELQHTGNGVYKADRKPQALQHYELRVSAPGFPSAVANTHITAMPAVKNVQASRAAPAFEQQRVNMSFELDDVPGQENFYYIEAFTPDTSYYDGTPYKEPVSIKFTAPIEDEFGMETRYFFSDKLFDGQALHLELNLDNNPSKTTYVRVAHITKEYYQYVRVLDKQSYRDNFSEIQEPVPNNIQNGMGLFAGYNAVTLAVKP